LHSLLAKGQKSHEYPSCREISHKCWIYALPKPAGNRSFGLLIGGPCLVVGAWHYWTGVSGHVAWLIVAAAFLLPAWLMPRVLSPLRRGWLRFGHVLSLIISPIMLGLIYVTAIIPVGLMTRVFGKDLLSIKRQPTASTYWVQREVGIRTPQSLKDQF
jgi:hypothetical protein